MLTRILKWIFKNIAPYLFGISVGVGFFFLVVRFAPVLPETSTLGGLMVTQHVEERFSASLLALQNFFTEAEEVSEPSVGTLASVEEPPGAETIQPLESSEPSGADVEPEPETVVALDEVSREVTHVPPATVAEQPLESPVESQMVDQMEQQESLVERIMEKTGEKEGGTGHTTPVVENTTPLPPKPVGCGAPPSRPGRAMDQYLACQWRENCLNRLSRARKLIQRDRKRCPTHGTNAQSCLAYYHALERQYHPALCSGWPRW